jgi:hypothetical protein
MRELHGHVILIVETAIDRFVLELQHMIEHAGATTMVARNPRMAKLRSVQMSFTGAVANAQHRELMQQLGLPALLYDRREIEDEPSAIVAQLANLLALGGGKQCETGTP